MKLFAIFVGGDLPGAHIELHDMRFVAAPSVEETHDELRRQWWGTPKSLHVDCWAELVHADGHHITLRAEPVEDDKRLYYVNLGGYDRAQFTEQHKNVFVVARSMRDAKLRALATVAGWDMPHKDDIYEAEQIIDLERQLDRQKLFIHLTPSDRDIPLAFTCCYLPIGRKDPD